MINLITKICFLFDEIAKTGVAEGGSPIPTSLCHKMLTFR